MRFLNGQKIHVTKETRIDLPDGRQQVTFEYADGYVYSFKHVKYWHPYELKYPFRDMKAQNWKSYVKLGQKLKALGVLDFEAEDYSLERVMDALEKHMPMNIRPYAYQGDKRTWKQIGFKNFKKEVLNNG